MTTSERKLRSIYTRKVDPVLGRVSGWTEIDPGTASSSWVAGTRDARDLVERVPDQLRSDLEAQWDGSPRSRLLPLAQVLGRLVGKVSPREKKAAQVSSTVYEMS